MDPLDVHLRDVQVGDLEIFFQQQLDPEATAMAAFPAWDHESHMAHWHKLLSDETLIKKAIVVDGVVAGNIGSWTQDGHREVGYWIGKEHWGKGIMTAAMLRFLSLVEDRPIEACVATGNAASIRVLEKSGFVFVRRETKQLVYRIDV